MVGPCLALGHAGGTGNDAHVFVGNVQTRQVRLEARLAVVGSSYTMLSSPGGGRNAKPQPASKRRAMLSSRRSLPGGPIS